MYPGTGVLLRTTGGRMLIVHTGAIHPKQTRDTQGVAVMTLKKNALVDTVVPFEDRMLNNADLVPHEVPACGRSDPKRAGPGRTDKLAGLTSTGKEGIKTGK